ncbi:hypothetical protein [Altererythrobacter sp. MTPC7]|uniref:hypothetical protein n=1 Tax=Altererythrobacter sp. MTPC7 TaxID=3056567 RepID=UPI0036F38365
MALSKGSGANPAVRVWVSGASSGPSPGTTRVHIENDDREDTEREGYQHQGAYEALIDVMLEEHRSGTTDLVVETGNRTLLDHLVHGAPVEKEHLLRDFEIVGVLKRLFDTVRLKFVAQERALPKVGGSRHSVLGRPSGNQDGDVI